MRTGIRLWLLAPLTAVLALGLAPPMAGLAAADNAPQQRRAVRPVRPAVSPREKPREVRLAGSAVTVFVQLGQLYGVSIEVEPTFPARRLELRLGETDFPTAMRIATQLAGAFSVERPDGSVLVAEDTAANRALYLPQVMKTFVLPGRTPEELTETIRLLREVLDMKRIVPNPATNTFTVRDTPQRLAVAEALLEQLLAEPGEVWVDVEVLEVDRNRALELGLVPPDTVIVQNIAAGAPEPRTSYRVVLPGTELLLRRLSIVTLSTRHLSLRAREGEEATFFVGELFPVVFATFSSSFISPLEQDLRDRGEFVPPVPAVRYEELGVRVRVRPRLHSSRELTLALGIEQKALTGTTVSDIPVLSKRSLEHQVRLRTGETLVLGGLRSDSRQVTTRDLALDVSAPVETTELIVLVTPRLLREPLPDRLALRTLYVGTENEFAPAGGAPPPAARPQPPPPQPPQPPPAVRPPTPPPPQPPAEEEEEEEEE